jgi:CRISPR system Cascade subunit CasA
MNNLLSDPLLPVRLPGGEARAYSLPQVLAALSAGDIETFPGLAAHQRQSWYAFLTQLGAIALEAADPAEPPDDPAAWRALLECLAPGEADTAWSLIVADAARPAFLQPPVGLGDLGRYTAAMDTPDGLDLLQTAKDHDLKMARLGAAAPHHWVYALVSLQTMQGYSGRDNFGIARMNGGFASRALVDFVPSLAWGDRFRRGLRLLRDSRDRVLEAFPDYFAEDGGKALLWLYPWDDDTAFGLNELHPWFIEICRRIRLVHDPRTRAVTALGRSGKAARVEAKAATGNLGDPWVPVDTRGAALTVGAAGFDYRHAARLLFSPDYTPPASLVFQTNDPPAGMQIHMVALVRGQGRTDGLHERVLPTAHLQAGDFTDAHRREAVHKLAQELIEDVGERAKRALRLGLCALMQGGKDDLDFRDERARPWLDRLDRAVDAMFFDHLWALAAAPDAADRDRARAAWRSDLIAITRGLFNTAADRVPTPSARRERARGVATNVFEGYMHNHLPPPEAGTPQTEEQDVA